MTPRQVASGFLHYFRRVLWETLVNGIASSPACPHWLRVIVYRAIGVTLPQRPNVAPGLYLESGQLRIGNATFINRHVRVHNRHGMVHVGDGVEIAMGVTIVTDTHSIGPTRHRAGEQYSQMIVIGDGSWIGANVTLLPGVIIGAGCVVAAGAVVTCKCEPNGLYAGVPARRVKDLS